MRAAPRECPSCGHRSLHDHLTGLPGRELLEKRLAHAVHQARRGRPSSALLLDLDRLRVLNFSAGHAVGDLAIKGLAQVLRGAARAADFVARPTGSEFCMILEGDDVEAARTTAEWIRRTVGEQRFLADGRPFDLGVSIGVVPVDGRLEAHAVLSLAGTALHAAKERGRNRVAVLDSEWYDETSLWETGRWVSRVKDALRNDLFVIHYQPIVDLSTGQTRHAEALVRMRGADGGVIGPSAFLPAAEAAGLAATIDLWVIGRVLADLPSCPGVDVFVNLSGSSLSDDDFMDEAERRVEAAGADPRRLVFEVTEAASVGNLEQAGARMQRQRDLGYRFALDDFGTGFSSLAYLRSLPADFLKIDGSFVRGLAGSLPNRAFVRAIVTIAETLGLTTVAECVEDPGLAPLLRSLGVEMGQGFGLAFPEPVLASAALRATIGA